MRDFALFSQITLVPNENNVFDAAVAADRGGGSFDKSFKPLNFCKRILFAYMRFVIWVRERKGAVCCSNCMFTLSHPASDVVDEHKGTSSFAIHFFRHKIKPLIASCIPYLQKQVKILKAMLQIRERNMATCNSTLCPSTSTDFVIPVMPSTFGIHDNGS
jgi:hypothetical protein